MFKYIKAKNIFSWAELYYPIQAGISQITGFNYDDGREEGSGKSSIANILSWTLYGKIPKDVKIDEVIKTGEDSCSGEVGLEDGSRIIRIRKPNELYILDDCGKKHQGKDAKETQELIEKKIGMKFDTFCQAVYFAQNYEKKFITSNESDKAKILSDIQDLSIFDKARKNVMDDLSKSNTALTKISYDLLTQKRVLEEVQEKEQLLVSVIESFEKDKKNQVNTLEGDLEQLNSSQRDIKEKLKAIDVSNLIEQRQSYLDMLKALQENEAEINLALKNITLDSQKSALVNSNFIKTSTKILDITKKIELLENNTDKTCPTCGNILSDEKQELHKKHQKELLESQLNEALENRDLLVVEASLYKNLKDDAALKKSLAEIQQEKDTINKVIKDLDKEVLNVNILKANSEGVVRELQRVELKLQQVKLLNCNKQLEELEKTNERISILSKLIGDLEDSKAALERNIIDLGLLKDGFKEVKSFIFMNLLESLSQKSTEIAQNLFEVPIFIKFSNEDSDGISKIITEVQLDGISRSLGLLSGGQFRRVQIAVDLALSHTVANRREVPINIRVLDEVFKDLSLTTMNSVVRLLETLEGSTIIVEHNPLIKAVVNQVFEIDYRGGTSHAI